MSSGEPKILLDCDVFIHFLKGGRIYELFKIFPGRFVMLDKVKKELLKRSSNQLAVAVVFGTADIEELAMPTDKEIVKEYFALKKQMDDGEAACLSVARFRKEFVASSNITQISNYCATYQIGLYTTMDLLLEACERGVLTEGECDQFIVEVRSRNSKLPCISLAEYKKMKK
jgi:predicted nucleic acid-binding protein